MAKFHFGGSPTKMRHFTTGAYPSSPWKLYRVKLCRGQKSSSYKALPGCKVTLLGAQSFSGCKVTLPIVK